MTENSTNAYIQTEELRQSNKNKVFEALKTERNQSRFEIGRKTGLGDIESQRRLSDLYNEGKAIITGSRKHFNQEVSLYSVKDQLDLFPKKKKPRLRKWLEQEAPELLTKYDVLYNHAL